MLLFFISACLNNEANQPVVQELTPLYQKLQNSGFEELTLKAKGWLEYSEDLQIDEHFSSSVLSLKQSDALWITTTSSHSGYIYLLNYTREDFRDHFEKITQIQTVSDVPNPILEGLTITDSFTRGSLLIVASRQKLEPLHQWDLNQQIRCEIDTKDSFCLQLTDITEYIPAELGMPRCPEGVRCGKSNKRSFLKEALKAHSEQNSSLRDSNSPSQVAIDFGLINQIETSKSGTAEVVLIEMKYRTRK